MAEERATPKPRAHYAAWRRVALRWSDNDVYGHANNAAYWQWFDTAVNGWLIEGGLLDVARGEVVAFVVETRCRYLRPFSYPGTVEIGIAVARLGRSSVGYRLGAFAEGADEAGAEALWTQVCVERGSGRPVAVPASWRARLSALEEAHQGAKTMDIGFTPAEEAFRDEVRSFLRERLPPRTAAKVLGSRRLTREDLAEWHALLNERGWLAVGWPVDRGGPGWTVMQGFIFDLECALAGAPRVVPFGVKMLGPVLMKYGTEAQKAHYLPRILDGSDWWCQGYSEPGAGSDLASLKTAAVRDGDHYVINGQKTWTTLAQYADHIFCLVRTDTTVKKQEGISFLLVDMRTPGVEVRPIVTLDGEHEVNEVFFTDVRVPAENLVGRENEGWTVAKYLLTHERTNIAGIGESMQALSWLRRIASREMSNGRPLDRDPLFAARLAKVEIDLENMKTTNLRVLAAAQRGGAPGAESSILKIRGTEIRQELTSLTRRALGPYAQPFTPEALDEGYNGEPVGPEDAAPAAAEYFNNRKLSIYGGSNEVQRGIVAKALLRL